MFAPEGEGDGNTCGDVAPRCLEDVELVSDWMVTMDSSPLSSSVESDGEWEGK